MRSLGGYAFGLVILLAASGWVDAVDKSDVPQLVRNLKSRDSDLRRRAARDLGEIGPDAKEAIPALAAALNDRDMFVRRFAARSLGRICTDANDFVPPLTRSLLSSGTSKELGSDPTKVAPVFARELRKLDRPVIQAVLRALGQMGQSAVPYLVAVLKEDDTRMQTLAAQAIGQIGPDAKAAVPALIEVFRSGLTGRRRNRTNEHRVAAVEALGRIGSGAKAARPVLEKAAKERIRDRTLRSAIRTALRRIR